MGKRGQVTFFIILGFILVVATVLIVLLQNEVIKEKINSENFNKLELQEKSCQSWGICVNWDNKVVIEYAAAKDPTPSKPRKKFLREKFLSSGSNNLDSSLFLLIIISFSLIFINLTLICPSLVITKPGFF